MYGYKRELVVLPFDDVSSRTRSQEFMALALFECYEINLADYSNEKRKAIRNSISGTARRINRDTDRIITTREVDDSVFVIRLR